MSSSSLQPPAVMPSPDAIADPKTYYSLLDFAELNEVSDIEIHTLVSFFAHDKGNILNKRFEYFDKEQLKFTNCRFLGGVFIHFIPQVITRDVTLKLNFEKCYINSRGVSKKNLIQVSEGSQLKVELTFINCIITKLDFENCNFQHISFLNCIIVDEAVVLRKCNIDSIVFSNTIGNAFIVDCLKANLQITYHEHNEDLTEDNLNLLLSDVANIDPTAVPKFKARYNVTNTEKTTVTFQKSSTSSSDALLEQLLVDLSFDYSNIDKAWLRSTDALLNSLLITGKTDSNINLNGITTNSFYLHDFSTKESIFTDLRSRGEASKLEVRDSDLSQVWFNKADLKSFTSVNFYRATLEKTRFTVTEFPEKIESLPNINYPDKKNADSHVEQYENYRQLKKTLSDQGNLVQSLSMHGKMYDAIEKDKSLSSQDRFILLLNRISNRHATSIKRAAFLFLILAIALHILNMAALPDAPYHWGWDGFYYFYEAIRNTIVFSFSNLEKFFILINPTHRISDLSLNEDITILSIGNYALSFFARISIAWIYYQFIMAFRKFGKQ